MSIPIRKRAGSFTKSSATTVFSQRPFPPWHWLIDISLFKASKDSTENRMMMMMMIMVMMKMIIIIYECRKEMYDYTGNNFNYGNSNKKFTETFGSHTSKT